MNRKLETYLIDDNKMDLFINEKIVSHYKGDCNIKSFDSAIEALDFFKHNLKRFKATIEDYQRILLLDINMPGMNGFEFLNALVHLENFEDNIFSIYFLSSSSNGKDISKILTIDHCKGYLNKPLTREIFRSLLSADVEFHKTQKLTEKEIRN